MSDNVNAEFPTFESDDEMRDWFETADLSTYEMADALEVVVATHVQLVIGDDDLLVTSSGTTGSLRSELVVTADS